MRYSAKPLLDLDRTSRLIWSSLALALIPMTGLLDLASGAEFTFSLVYVFPVIILAWIRGMAGGITASLVTGSLWLYVDFAAERYLVSTLAYSWNFVSRIAVLVLLSILVAALQRSLHDQYLLARTDPLTGTLNRRAFTETATQEIWRAVRYRRPLTLAYFDLDNFKSVNDNCGHRAGDRLLFEFARALCRNVRRTDIVARLGGDEFAILFSECGVAEARAAVLKVQQTALTTFHGKSPVTVSIGAVTYLKAPVSVDAMIDRADRLMYEVKSGGKDAVRFAVES